MKRHKGPVFSREWSSKTTYGDRWYPWFFFLPLSNGTGDVLMTFKDNYLIPVVEIHSYGFLSTPFQTQIGLYPIFYISSLNAYSIYVYIIYFLFVVMTV